LPRIVERCGARRQGGSITAIFTVLSESDDVDDPIVEVMKSLLDGHIILSRKLAQIGHYPAIDVGQSVSRLFDSLADAQQRKAAVRCRALIARYEEARILIESGMYKAGGDPELDLAVRSHAEVNGFLRQADQQGDRWETTRSALIKLAEAA
jgi:flagellum-specific ATP synthase